MSEDSDVIRVVGAVADKTQVTLYLESGETKIIRQGDLRLNDLLNKIIPITTAGGVAVVSLENLNVYQDFEKKSGGLIKFFKGAKKAIGKLFGGSTENAPEEITLPPVQAPPVATPTTGVSNVRPTTPAPVAPPVAQAQLIPTHTIGENTKADPTKQKVASGLTNQIANKPEPIKENKPVEIKSAGNLDKVKEHLKPLDNDDIQEDETIVAVIGDMAIPDMEKLKPYIQHSVKANSTEGVSNFLKRLVPMIGKREHSIVDIMRFLEKGDLPLANDGTILAYKKLKTVNHKLVDCHTGKIQQRVGSFVCVDESLVDKNRRNECSNGLHIGRRAYMGSFGGDTIVLTKVAPEDIVVVPHNDANKVRVMGYHIIGILSPSAYSDINYNRAMTNNKEASEMLARAIKGDHVERLEEVRVHGQAGSNVVITPLVKGKRKEIADRLTNAELSRGRAFDDPTSGLGAIDPKAINKQVNDQIEKSGMTASDTFKNSPGAETPKTEEPKTVTKTDPLPKAPGIKAPVKKAQAPKPQPAKTVDVINNPSITKFINTFSGANLEIANFAETAFKAGRNVYRALKGEFDYKAFIANIPDENLFNDEVRDIFTTFGTKVEINEALKQGKKSPAKKPATKPTAKAPAKATSKPKTPSSTNSSKTDTKTPTAKPKAPAKVVAKATGTTKPSKAKAEPKKKAPAVSVKESSATAAKPVKAKAPVSPHKPDVPKAKKPTSKVQPKK